MKALSSSLIRFTLALNLALLVVSGAGAADPTFDVDTI